MPTLRGLNSDHFQTKNIFVCILTRKIMFFISTGTLFFADRGQSAKSAKIRTRKIFMLDALGANSRKYYTIVKRHELLGYVALYKN